MNKYKVKLVLLFALTFIFTGCSDENKPNVAQKKDELSNKPEYFDVDVKPDAKSTGYVTVMLGKYHDKINEWVHKAKPDEYKGLLETIVPEDERPDYISEPSYLPGLLEANLAGVFNEPQKQYKVSFEDMATVLAGNPDGLGSGTSRPDFFQPGHYSAFDLLRYLAITRDDVVLSNVIHWKDTGLGTYTFDVSFDRNGDGDFDDVEDSKNDPNWHFRFLSVGGKEMTETEKPGFGKSRGNTQGFTASGEASYLRLDTYWLQPDVLITFEKFTKEMTARRQWQQKQQVDAFIANGNKAKVNIVVMDTANHKLVASVNDVEVEAFNHRSDIFQLGVITELDALLSAREALGGVSFTWWGELSTGVNVEHYATSRIGTLRSLGMKGFGTTKVYPSNVKKSPMDFGMSASDFKRFPVCDWKPDGSPATEGDETVSKEACYRDWDSTFGGEMVHLMTDVHPITYGNVYILYGYLDLAQYYTKQPTREADKPIIWDFDRSEDGQNLATVRKLSLPEAMIGNAPILNEAHFGWKIADCMQCHNDTEKAGHGGFSWPVNTADGFDSLQPYYCASCHGSNGAPQAHREKARCFWCHSSGGKLTPKNHGDAVVKKLYSKQEIEGHKFKNNFHSPLVTGLPADKWGNYSPAESLWSSKNSDWDMSEIFPDPYSCVTCHVSK